MTDSDRTLEWMLDCPLPSGFEEACHAFSKVGATTPIVIWSPERLQLMHPMIEKFASLCDQHCRADGQFYAADLDLANFDALMDWIMILRIDQESRNLIYAHYGKGIADHFGQDMTGLTTSHFDGHISQFFTAAYLEVAHRREWLLTDHEPPKRVFVCSWRRLIVPLVGPRDDITGFIAINVPESPLRAGLDLVPEPLMVLDAAQTVRFANAFARTLFGVGTTAGHECRFEDLTGVALQPSGSAEEMFAKSVVDNRIVRLEVADRLRDDFLITISGAIHSGSAYYIVMLRILTARDAGPDASAGVGTKT